MLLLRPRRLFSLLLVCALYVGPAIRADIEFAGIIDAGGNPTFGLDDSESKDVKWVTVGQKFLGWTVSTYDEKNETLVLTNGDARKTLHLKDAVIKEAAPSTIAGNVVIKVGDRSISQSLTLQADQPSVIPLGDGTQLKVTLQKQPSGEVRYELSTERVPGADGQPGEVLGSSRIDAQPNMAVGISVNGAGSESGSFAFTPKAAASAQSASSPEAAPLTPEAPAPAPADAPVLP